MIELVGEIEESIRPKRKPARPPEGRCISADALEVESEIVLAREGRHIHIWNNLKARNIRENSIGVLNLNRVRSSHRKHVFSERQIYFALCAGRHFHLLTVDQRF